MISVLILDHAAERGSSVIAVDQTNLIDARPDIAKRPVYTAHRFIAHEAVEIYDNKWAFMAVPPLAFAGPYCNTVSCFACPSSHDNRDSNEYHQKEGVKQVGNDRKAADTGQTCRNK